MTAGEAGVFAVSWQQTEIDGWRDPAAEALSIGACWRWFGAAMRLDGPPGVMRLTGDAESGRLHGHAARMAGRLLHGRRGFSPPRSSGPARRAATDAGPAGSAASAALRVAPDLVLTDGRRAILADLLDTGDGRAPLLVFAGTLPAAGAEHWVVQRAPVLRRPCAAGEGGVICFAAGTRIATPAGWQAVETLRPGDMVLTRDDGPQPVLWRGRHRLTGARLFAQPHLRPIRIEPGALGPDAPLRVLRVSPEHRLLLGGGGARALFGEPEVLVRAGDLVGLPGIRLDCGAAAADYVHLLLERHQVFWAEGAGAESFYPDAASLAAAAPDDRARLGQVRPDLLAAPAGYGPPARRRLNAPEAALLRHDHAA